jgi:hypothetical protein
MAYDGFISYSHAADGRLAPALQGGLQLLAKPWNSRRALRIFRDETGLSTDPNLWSAIERALEDSDWFILLASPASAQSQWVNKEIIRWIDTKSVDHILPVVTDGTWNWDAAAGDFTAESSAVPDALRGTLHGEPRHLDLRWAKTATDLDLRNSRFRSAVADIAAPIHGVAKDELEGEDIRQHRRTRRLARSAVGALAILVVIATVVSAFAISQRDSARAATATAHQELLVADSQTQISSNPELATLLAVEADRRVSTPASRNALVNAVLAEPYLQRRFGGETGDVAVLGDNRIASIAGLGNARGKAPNQNVVQLWNWQTGRRLRWPDAPFGDAQDGPLDVASTADGSALAVLLSNGTVQFYSGPTLKPDGDPVSAELGRLPVTTAGFTPAGISLSANGQTLAVNRISPAPTGPLAGDAVAVFSRVNDRWVRDPAPGTGASDSVVLSPDGSLIATASPTANGSEVAIRSVHTGAIIHSFGAGPTNGIAVDWARDRVVLSQLPGSGGDVVWYSFDEPDPAPHEITVGSGKNSGQAWATYDNGYTRLGINSADGTELFDAATLGPLTNEPVFPTNNYAGPFIFLDSDHVLTGTFINGPMSVWNLSGTPALATQPPTTFNLGAFPALPPGMLDGFSSIDGTVSETVLGSHDRPLGPPFVVGEDEQDPSAPVQVAQSLPPVECPSSRRARFVTVSEAGSINVRASSPPFAVLSSDPEGAAGLGDPILCALSPDGGWAAIGNYSPAGHASVVLYDVARRKVIANLSLNGEISITGLVFSADSKTLWIGGPTFGENGVYRVTGLDGTPRVTTAFPGGSGIATDADDQRLIVAYPSALRVFDAQTGAPLTRAISIPGSSIYAVSSSPDGQDAVVNTTQGWRLIDLAAQQPTGPWIPDLAPSLPVMGADDTIYTQAVTGGGEVWDLNSVHLRTVACSLAGRNLTPQEWQQYLPWAGPRRATCPQYPLS